MKKAYMKPEILFESFALSTNIAGDCEKDVGHPTKDACGIPTTSGDTVFVADICDIPLNPDDEYDGFCYHVPFEQNNFFNS